jgi:hypothetical protein
MWKEQELTTGRETPEHYQRQPSFPAKMGTSLEDASIYHGL